MNACPPRIMKRHEHATGTRMCSAAAGGGALGKNRAFCPRRAGTGRVRRMRRTGVQGWTPRSLRAAGTAQRQARIQRFLIGLRDFRLAPDVYGATLAGSMRTIRLAPTAVTAHVKVQPFAWNIGRVHRYRSAAVMGQWAKTPSTFTHALRCVIITPLGFEGVPLV